MGNINKSGGDVIKFLGDAVLIIFPVDKDSDPVIKSTAVLMACICALRLVNECGEYKKGEGANQVLLRLHCAVSCGLIHCIHVGKDDNWHFFVSGKPLNEIGQAISLANIDEICISEGSYFHVHEYLEAKKVSKDAETFYTLTGKRVTTSMFSNNNNLTSGNMSVHGSYSHSVYSSSHGSGLNASPIRPPGHRGSGVSPVGHVNTPLGNNQNNGFLESKGSNSGHLGAFLSGVGAGASGRWRQDKKSQSGQSHLSHRGTCP